MASAIASAIDAVDAREEQQVIKIVVVEKDLDDGKVKIGGETFELEFDGDYLEAEETLALWIDWIHRGVDSAQEMTYGGKGWDFNPSQIASIALVYERS